MSTDNQCTADRPCTAMQLLTQRLIDTEGEIKEIKDDVKAIRDRLPPWVTGIAAGAGVLIGVLGTLASK